MREKMPTAPLGDLANFTMGQSPGSANVNGDERELPFLQGCAEFGTRYPFARVHCFPPLRIAKAGSTLISVRALVRIAFFDDRIETENPGILLPGMTVEDMRQGVSRIRNHVIARVFRELGLIEQWGSGVRRMFREAAEQGVPEPEFIEIGMRMRVTVWRAAPIRLAASDAQDSQRLESPLAAKVLIWLQAGEAGKSALANHLGHRSVSGELHKQVRRLPDLFTRGVTADGQLRPPREEAPQLYKESPLGWIPKEWELKACAEICLSVIDCKNRTPPVTEVGHPVIRTPNVRDGEFVWKDLAYTDAVSYVEWTARGRPVPGDVVITREAPVGEVCMIPEDLEAPCLGQRMML